MQLRHVLHSWSVKEFSLWVERALQEKKEFDKAKWSRLVHLILCFFMRTSSTEVAFPVINYPDLEIYCISFIATVPKFWNPSFALWEYRHQKVCGASKWQLTTTPPFFIKAWHKRAIKNWNQNGNARRTEPEKLHLWKERPAGVSGQRTLS